MISLDLFGGLTPTVQLVLAIGILAIIFLIAWSRAAAANLLNFLHALSTIRRPCPENDLQSIHQFKMQTDTKEEQHEPEGAGLGS